MPESKAPEPEDRKKEDLERVNQICEILEVGKEFGKPVRIGKKTAGSRPLCITAKYSEHLTKSLRSARNLAEHDDQYKKGHDPFRERGEETLCQDHE